MPDRWTYKWYVIAVSGSGATTTSNIRTFSVYVPTLETVADGVSIVNGSPRPQPQRRDRAVRGLAAAGRDPGQRPARPDDGRRRRRTRCSTTPRPSRGRAGTSGRPARPDLHTTLLASAGTRLGIPFVSAGDTIHGYQTTYPTQSALAAARNYALDYKLGDMQRREQLEVGTRGVLGPLAEVGTKVLYPRIQEGNGENADVAAAQVRALVAGLQGGPELNPRLGAGDGQALARRGRRRRGADRLRRGHHQVPHDPVPGRDGGRRGQHHARLRRAARCSTRAAPAPATARRSWPTCGRTWASPV